MPARDLTAREFQAACRRHGIKRDFFGYYDVGNGLLAYARNDGSRRRDQLAYLIKRQRDVELLEASHA